MKRVLKIFIFLAITSFVALAFFRWGKNNKKETRLASNQSTTLNPTENSQASANNTSDNQAAQADLAQNNVTPAAQDQPASQNSTSNAKLPAKFLLNMPFYSQTPLGKWDATHENTCEEASVLNGGLYLLGKKLAPAEFDQEMMAMINIEKKLSINFSDSTVTEAKQFSDAYFSGKISSKIMVSPTIEDIETEIAAGHPVIVPLSGRDIGNPNFTPPGPVYHMLTVKGYDALNFITNDVGTRKGDSYAYPKDLIIQNMHDWNAQDIHLGAKKALVLYK